MNAFCWNYFKKKEKEDDKNKLIAVCQVIIKINEKEEICNEILTYNGSTTSNLNKHLKVMHKIIEKPKEDHKVQTKLNETKFNKMSKENVEIFIFIFYYFIYFKYKRKK
mgnify:CR=1 FL=1